MEIRGQSFTRQAFGILLLLVAAVLTPPSADASDDLNCEATLTSIHDLQEHPIYQEALLRALKAVLGETPSAIQGHFRDIAFVSNDDKERISSHIFMMLDHWMSLASPELSEAQILALKKALSVTTESATLFKSAFLKHFPLNDETSALRHREALAQYLSVSEATLGMGVHSLYKKMALMGRALRWWRSSEKLLPTVLASQDNTVTYNEAWITTHYREMNLEQIQRLIDDPFFQELSPELRGKLRNRIEKLHGFNAADRALRDIVADSARAEDELKAYAKMLREAEALEHQLSQYRHQSIEADHWWTADSYWSQQLRKHLRDNNDRQNVSPVITLLIHWRPQNTENFVNNLIELIRETDTDKSSPTQSAVLSGMFHDIERIVKYAVQLNAAQYRALQQALNLAASNRNHRMQSNAKIRQLQSQLNPTDDVISDDDITRMIRNGMRGRTSEGYSRLGAAITQQRVRERLKFELSYELDVAAKLKIDKLTAPTLSAHTPKETISERIRELQLFLAGRSPEQAAAQERLEAARADLAASERGSALSQGAYR